MINTERIVPVMATDLLTLYALILKIDSDNADLAKLEADGIGDFSVDDGTNPLIAAEPVKTVDIAEDVTTATIYFVADYDFKGFFIAGVAVEATGDVDADGNTLYKAVLASGAVTITKVGL